MATDQRLRRALAKPVDADLIIYFRCVFGLVGLVWVIKQFLSGAIDVHFVAPRYHFHYSGFEWVRPFSETWTYVEFAGMGLAAILIILGAFYRLAIVLFALGFTHLFLSDKCLYQNHYYLLCLVAWLLVFIPANCDFSFDAWWFRRSLPTPWIPHWCVWLLRFQIAVPYVFGGIAKLSSDWLAGEPMGFMLAEHAEHLWWGSLLTEKWCVLTFAWGGMLFDLLVVPLLLCTKTRRFAMLWAIAFHLTNAALFTIGVFPWFMIFTLPIFWPPGRFRRWLPKPPGDRLAAAPSGAVVSTAFACVLVAYVGWQIVWPLRHFALVGHPNWTEEGHTFAWHMLLRGKRPAVRFLATDPRSQRTGTVNLRNYVTPLQLHRVGRDPRLIHELANIIARDMRRVGFPEIQVRVLALVSMNGRRPQLLVDPRVDLSRETIGWRGPAWIVPLTEPLPEHTWREPISQWERLVPIPDVYQSVPVSGQSPGARRRLPAWDDESPEAAEDPEDPSQSPAR